MCINIASIYLLGKRSKNQKNKICNFFWENMVKFRENH